MLIVSPPGHIIDGDPQRFGTVGDRATLLTSDEISDLEHERLRRVFSRVECFDDYLINDHVVARAAQLIEQEDHEHVISFVEADLMRIAALRARYELPGLRPETAVGFRDKIKMKTLASARGISVPAGREINTAVDLLTFLDAVGYPAILKPIAGRGSANTFRLADAKATDAVLRAGVIGRGEGFARLLAEEYVEGDQYRIDGLYADGQRLVTSISRYSGNPLAYLGGGWLISSTVDETSRIAHRLGEFVDHLLGPGLGLSEASAFHVQVFHTSSDELILGEAAARIGGGRVTAEVRASHEVDLPLELVHATIAERRQERRFLPQLRCAGKVLIAPRGAMLAAIPSRCPFPWVVEYRHKPAGRRYPLMTHTNAEIASAIVTGPNHAAVQDRLDTLQEYFATHVRWT
jgi:biotin carboxylase